MIKELKIGEALDEKYLDKTIKIKGWIYRKRSSGRLIFAVIRDSSGIIQTTIKKENISEKEFEDADKALIESSVKIEGIVKKDERAPGGFEIDAKRFKIVGFSEKFPITKDKSDEFLMDNRHLWIRSREMNAILKIRANVFNCLRNFFTKDGYYEIQSPSFVSGACEGGSTLFEVPYFGRKVYLTQSWQLYAEAMIYSLEKIFTIAPSFRAEKSRTRRHVTEFWHCEVEEAWVHNEDMMKLGEKLIEYLCQECLEKNRKELEYLKRDISKLEKIEAPFERMKYQEVIDFLNSKGFNIEWGDDFGYIEEKAITKDRELPLFITHFPREKGFYHRPDPKEPKTLLCHDLLAPEGYGEIIGGGERIYKLEVLLERLKEENLEQRDYEWYIDLRRYGSVPHAGFGLGIDRTITWITGASHIKYVIPFPRDIRRIYP